MDFDTASWVNSGSKCFKSAGPACEYNKPMNDEKGTMRSELSKEPRSPDRDVRPLL